MKFAMISQPKETYQEIYNEKRDTAISYLYTKGYRAINAVSDLFTTCGTLKPRLRELGQRLTIMSEVSLVYFISGWENDRNCKLEYLAAKEFDIEVEFEETVIERIKNLQV
jgi:hypothetical protein